MVTRDTEPRRTRPPEFSEAGMLRAKVASSIQHSGRAGRGRDRSASTAAIVGTWMASGWRAAPRAEQAGRESKSSFLRLGGHQVPSRAYLRTLHVRSMLDNTQTHSHCTNRGRRTGDRTPAAANGRERTLLKSTRGHRRRRARPLRPASVLLPTEPSFHCCSARLPTSPPPAFVHRNLPRA